MPITPGPWKRFDVGSRWGICPVTKNGRPRQGRDTQDVAHGSQFTDNWEEDAAAIVALPDLIAALLAIREGTTQSSPGLYPMKKDQVREIADKALRKAGVA